MKKQLYKEIIEMIRAMENNTFLLPDSWSELVQMASQPFSYKTYVGGRGSDRYINIEIYNTGKEYAGSNFAVNLRKDIVSIDGENVFGKRLRPAQIHGLIKDIYTEKHSFENHHEGERAIRTTIADCLKTISSSRKKIKELEQRLSDLKMLNHHD